MSVPHSTAVALHLSLGAISAVVLGVDIAGMASKYADDGSEALPGNRAELSAVGRNAGHR